MTDIGVTTIKEKNLESEIETYQSLLGYGVPCRMITIKEKNLESEIETLVADRYRYPD